MIVGVPSHASHRTVTLAVKVTVRRGGGEGGEVEVTSLDNIGGAEWLVERFGGWPTFHDAEIVRLTLDRRGAYGPSAELLVHASVMTDRTDERATSCLRRPTSVRLVFERLTACETFEFNQQNVLFELAIGDDKADGGAAFRVTLNPSFGLGGSLVCGRVVVADVTPCDPSGNPANSR